MAAPGQLLTIMQAAQRVGVSRRTIYNWLTTGKITPIYTPGGRIRLDEACLLQERTYAGASKGETPQVVTAGAL